MDWIFVAVNCNMRMSKSCFEGFFVLNLFSSGCYAYAISHVPY